jgi:LacI family transcriptional regulator
MSSITIQDVAARAHVSAMTVSRVLNHPDQVAPATRRRVEQAIRELGFVPNALARGLLQGRSYTIALLVGDIGNPFFTEVICGVEDVAQRNGYMVILANSDESPEKEHAYIHALMSRGIDGLLIASAGASSRPMLDLLLRRATPFVLIDRAIEGVPADTVIGDSLGGAQALTRHLLELGHRRIGFIGGPASVPTACDRRRGYLQTLQAHGIDPDPAWLVEGNFKRDGGYLAARQLLALPAERQPSAMVADNNFHAVGVIEALREAGRRVPDDIAVVCFDDVALASALHPFLTVVSQPARTFGTIAMQFLLERLNDQEIPLPRKVVLAPELIVRRSCGAHRNGAALEQPPAETPLESPL